MPRDDLPSADALEAVFHAALGEGDVEGVDATLRLLVVQAPRRAVELYDALRFALGVTDLVAAGIVQRPAPTNEEGQTR
jgi:hypothetical protein